ncbi:MAG: hypothetical protein IPP51_08190 [Bacteroidetes bacterium]|nr:hypothetical protein [Bacteroidota bacterium]
MNRQLAQFLSIVLHPVLMPTYALFFIFGNTTFLTFSTPDLVKKAIFYIVVINTLIFPVVITYILYRTKVIQSFQMERREERQVPYISNLLLLFVAAYLVHTLRLPALFFRLLLGAASSVMIALFVNFKWKISIHMIGIGALTGTLFGLTTLLAIDLRTAIVACFLVAGLLGTARLSLGAHQPMQIYAGFVVGFFCEYYFLGV